MTEASSSSKSRDENPAAVFSPKEGLAIDAPVGVKQHAEADLHLIDEALPAPKSVAALTSVASVGVAPTPARSDHRHAFADGTAGAPSIGWGNLGFYKAGAGILGLAINGVATFSWDSNRFYRTGVISIGNWSVDGAYAAVEGIQGYLLLGAGGDTTSYLRSNGNLALGAAAYGDRVIIGGSTVTISPTISCNAIYCGDIGCNNISGNYITANGFLMGGQSRITSSPNNSRWDLQQLRLESGAGTTTGLSMWVAAAGIAPVLRCFSGNGESIDCGNNPGTAYAQFGANNFVTWSTIAIKKNVERYNKATPDKRNALKMLRTATWDDIVPDMELVPTERFKDINSRWVESGHSPLQIRAEHTESRAHDCAISDCCGDETIKCGLHKRHHGRRGFVAEDVLEYIPEAVSMNNQNDVNGIDYSVIVAELWELVAHLYDKIELLEGKVK